RCVHTRIPSGHVMARVHVRDVHAGLTTERVEGPRDEPPALPIGSEGGDIGTAAADTIARQSLAAREIERRGRPGTRSDVVETAANVDGATRLRDRRHRPVNGPAVRDHDLSVDG